MHRAYVIFTDIMDEDGTWHNDSMWRISWRGLKDCGESWSDEMGFARREDAELALEALRKAGVTLEDFDAIGTEHLPYRQIICEALRW